MNESHGRHFLPLGRASLLVPLVCAFQCSNVAVPIAVQKSRSEGKDEMDNARFAKLCKDCGLYDKQFTTTDADLIFVKVGTILCGTYTPVVGALRLHLLVSLVEEIWASVTLLDTAVVVQLDLNEGQPCTCAGWPYSHFRLA